MATTAEEVTEAERLEARARKAMSQVTKSRGFDSAKVRAEDIAYVDMLLDQRNLLVLGR